MRASFLVALLIAAAVSLASALKDGDCEVCIQALTAIESTIKSKKELVGIEDAIGRFCDKATGEKEKKLCYYIVRRSPGRWTPGGIITLGPPNHSRTPLSVKCRSP